MGPPTIGMTGGIGSGKSTVASMFQSLDCIVANADENAKQALHDPEIKEQLVDWWGEAILNEDGNIDNAAIAAIIFEDESQRVQLESVLHPRARLLQEEQFQTATKTTKALIIDAPLLIEAGLDEQCDAIVFVDASIETRLNRIKTSRGWSEEEFNRREAAQLPLDKKREKADYVVTNEGNLGEVLHTVGQILEDIRMRQLKKS
jgi:dephospho-CoA kinase